MGRDLREVLFDPAVVFFVGMFGPWEGKIRRYEKYFDIGGVLSGAE